MGFGSFFSGTDSSAAKNQQKDNAQRQAFLQQQAALARGDTFALYPAGDYARNSSYDAALALMGQSAPRELGMFQGGNVAAQNLYLQGMPQHQNAILGMPVNNQALQPYQQTLPDPSSYRTQLPDFGSLGTATPPPTGATQWTQPPPQQQPQQFNPQQMMQMANTYNNVAPMFGGTPLWGGGAAASGSAPIAAGAGQASATGLSAAPMAGGASSGSGSMMASAGPWAALAAIIAANESKQQGDGNRGNSNSEWAMDSLTGKNLERDMDRYLPNNALGDTTKRAAMMSTPSGVVRNGKDLAGWLRGLF